MLINIKYDIGDKISWNREIPSGEMEKCPFCNGSKKIQGNDRTTLICPRCYGRGEIPKTKIISGEDVIQGIQVLYDTAFIQNYPNGPKITYYCTEGTFLQDEVKLRD